MKLLILISSAMLITSTAWGYANKCHRDSSYERIATSKCIGGSLPSSRMRNMHRNSHDIVCSGNVDSYVRRPQKLDKDKWDNLLNYNAQEAQDFAWNTLPEIKWSGTTTFKTIETWIWESCDLVTSGIDCGYDTEYYYENECFTDQKGNQKCQQVRKEREVPKSCYIDVEHREYEYCSTEEMHYSAKFVRPDKNSWKPGVPGYYDQIPLKYDLLPGESEVVQTYSTTSNYTNILNPELKIPGGWNEYNFRVSRGGFACEQLKAKGISPYEFTAEVHTIKRDVGKNSPNAFKLPVDFEGHSLDAILWGNDVDRKGIEHSKAYPKAVQLIDTAGDMVRKMAEQSRENGIYEKEKHKKGKITNKDGIELTDLKKDDKFFKNTQVKVVIKDVNRFWFDNEFGRVYNEDIDTVQASLNAISEDQDIARSDLWLINLAGKEKGKDDIYDGWNLKPRKDDYVIEVSMYQRGVPFYNQACEDVRKPPFWACNGVVRSVGLGRQERHYFSEPLVIPIPKTSDYDKRGFFGKFINFFGYR